MKTSIYTITACIISNIYLQAQDIKVKASNGSFSIGSVSCFETVIYYANLNDVMDEWKSKLKDFKNEKVKTSGKEIIADNLLIKELGNDPVDMYSIFDEKGDKSIEMKVAVDLGNNNYLKSGDKSKYLEKMMKEFAVQMSTESLDKQIKDQNKIIAEITDKQKSLEKKNEDLKKDIESYKEKIKKAEEEIKNNEAEIEKKKQELATQQKALDELKNKKSSIK